MSPGLPESATDAALLLQYAYRVHAAGGDQRRGVFRGYEVFVDSVEHVQFVHARKTADDGRSVHAVVFPGSNELRDWLKANFPGGSTEIKGVPGRWRPGYLRSAELVESAVEDWAGPNSEVRLYGHSMGAGVAADVAALLARNGCAAVVGELACFSPPLYTDLAGAAWLGSTYPRGFSLDFGADVVPHLLSRRWAPALRGLHVTSGGVLRSRGGWLLVLRELLKAVRRPGVQVVEHHVMSTLVGWLLAADKAEVVPLSALSAEARRAYWEIGSRVTAAQVGSPECFGHDPEVLAAFAHSVAATAVHVLAGRSIGPNFDEGYYQVFLDHCWDCGAPRAPIAAHPRCLVDRSPWEA